MIGVLKDLNYVIMNNSSQLSNLLDIKSAVISAVVQEDDMVHLLTISFLLDNLYFSKSMTQILKNHLIALVPLSFFFSEQSL